MRLRAEQAADWWVGRSGFQRKLAELVSTVFETEGWEFKALRARQQLKLASSRAHFCARRGVASPIQRAIERARLWRRAAPLAERFDLDRDPFRSLREAQHVAAADGAARLVDGSARLAAQEAHAAILNDARG